MEHIRLKGCFNIFTTIDEGNIAYHVTDKKDEVKRAREKLLEKYSFDISNLKYMDQVHGSDVLVVDEKREVYTCDAFITDKKDVVLMVMVADCIPILFFDPVKKIVGAAHAGRNGTFLDIASNTIKKMSKEFRSDPKDIQVLMGPSIQKCCYEVSFELAKIAKESFGEEFVDKRYIDLQGINKKQLRAAGLKEENIFISSVCTKCGGKKYFSYRLDKTCGRFAGLISL